jgi:outer membrane protein OmpA-like peptidoglycan-associated protein
MKNEIKISILRAIMSVALVSVVVAADEDTDRQGAHALQQFHSAAKPTTQDVIDLLQLKIPPDDIISEIAYLHAEQPLQFALGDAEVARLKQAGATDALITAMRSPGRAAAREAAQAETANSASPSPADSSSPAAEKTPEPEQSLVSVAAGAYVVKRPKEWMADQSAFHMLDEKERTFWSTPRGDISPQTIVIALPEKTLLKTLEFDNSHIASQFAASSAKDITVEMSDTSENDGFQTIAEVSLKDRQDHQRFPVSAEVAGRWLRLNVKNNHNPEDNDNCIQLSEFRGFGTQLTQTPMSNISGTYDTYFTGGLHLKQQGTSVTGCYESRGGRVVGGIEGRAFKFTWFEKVGYDVSERGVGTAVFSPDGKQLFSLWSEKIGRDRLILGTKKSDQVGSCPGWASEVQDQLTKDLEAFGRTRVYGINFDTDKDIIKEESKPTLDKIVAMLKAKPEWKITIEGHTDSTSTPQHNQGLSERRAASVKNYLTAAGIEGSRLTTAGYGQTKPVASNDDPLGRAQNRRVELGKL